MDKYDEAVAYLTERPIEIELAWYTPCIHPAGCLFRMVRPDGVWPKKDDGVGCVTMIKRNPNRYSALGRPDITEMIRNWPGIPEYGPDATPADLPAFAELWRAIDAAYEQGEI